MKFNKQVLILSTTIAALLLLLLFQIYWLQQSKLLIEEQFDQKVDMAMCMAVGRLTNTSAATCAAVGVPAPSSPPPDYSLEDVEEIVEQSMAFYNIDTYYQIEITDEPLPQKNTAYCCALSPFSIDSNGQQLQVTFPGKSDYIFHEIRFMLISSVLILVLLSILFGFINWMLISQKRITDRNIDFFNNMAHEFKTPLTNIHLATSILSKKEDHLKSNKFIQIVQQEGHKLMEQVERILQLSKFESGEQYLNIEKLEINTLLQESIEQLDVLIQEKNGRIQFENSPYPLYVQGDKLHLTNVFRNLIDNALKYCEIAPSIHIFVKEKENQIHIQFQDNGIGITKANQNYIFEKYQRVPKGNIHNIKGFGLGLAYVKKVVQLHKGTVKVISQLHKGSRFDLTFPLTNS